MERFFGRLRLVPKNLSGASILRQEEEIGTIKSTDADMNTAAINQNFLKVFHLFFRFTQEEKPMKSFFLPLTAALLLAFNLPSVVAAPGDTTIVQTFTYGWPLMPGWNAPHEGKFLFPDKSKRWEKILMYYTLKCDPAQNPACGEWDYLTYALLMEHTGVYDTSGNEILTRWELGRFITPYGINLSLGDGWTWTYDVTDFAFFLADSVHLRAGNFQELLDMKFLFIEGTPPRDVVAIQNVWQLNSSLKDFETNVPPKTIDLDPNAKTFKLRTTVTGHDFDNATNCAEFCPKTHSIDVDGVRRYSWQIVQECAENPLYPQGGTWIYDRAGWCPGMPGTTKEWEITPFVTGSHVTIDYNSQYDQFGRYDVESQFVQYTAANHQVDASVEDILTPSTYEMYSRFNPSCSAPRIIIQNRGALQLTSLDITYGPVGGNMNLYSWNGSLAFMEKKELSLPPFDWGSASSSEFEVNISNPNGTTDEYTYNNTQRSHFESVPVFDEPLIINFRTNGVPAENRYEILDANGNSIYAKAGLPGNRLFRDTVALNPGCYEFILWDYGDDGISFWANNDGTGSIVLRFATAGVYKTLNPDFGKYTSFQFRVGTINAVRTPDATVKSFAVFPNPTSTVFEVEFALDQSHAVHIELHDILGKKVLEIPESRFDAGSHVVPLKIDGITPGQYFLTLSTDGVQHKSISLHILK